MTLAETLVAERLSLTLFSFCRSFLGLKWFHKLLLFEQKMGKHSLLSCFFSLRHFSHFLLERFGH